MIIITYIHEAFIVCNTLSPHLNLFMANRWEKMETVTAFIFLGSKITADGNCSHEIKRHFLLGRKAMTNLGNVLKSRYFPLSTKVCLVKATVFAVVMYGCESWTIKKAEGTELMLWNCGVLSYFLNLILFNFTILYWFCHISK